MKENKINIKLSRFDKIIKKFIEFYNKMKVSIETLQLIDEYNELILNLKNKIFSPLNINEIKEDYFYEKILMIIESIIDVDKNERIAFKFLEAMYLYISNQIISINKNEDIKNKAFELFLNSISKFEDLYENYILYFQIKEKLSKYLENKENLLNFKDNSIILIKHFNLQNILCLKEYILKINDNSIDYCLINHLFHTYNKTEEKLSNLYQFIISKIPKNSIPFMELQNIFDNNCFKEEFKKLLIDNMLKPLEEKSDKYYSLFYNFIYKNKLDKYFSELKEEKFLFDLIFNLKFYCAALTIIKSLNKENIKSLNKSLLKELLYSIDSEDINSKAFLLEFLPEELDKIVNEYLDEGNKKDLIKLIKKINIKKKTDNKIIKNIEEKNINNFYLWKIKIYFKTQLDVLVEYIKTQKEFEVFIKLISQKIENNSINKLSYILNYAKNKGFILPEINNEKWNLLIKEVKNGNNKIIFPEDIFGPRREGCISYSRNEINIIFIQNSNDLIKSYELYFEKSKYIGIDTEWRDSLYLD